MIKLIDILTELTLDQHYLDRKIDRVDNIRKVIVPNEALGNFTLSEIQEPLINAIKSKLSLKLTKLEKDDLPRSIGRFIGYKIFAPFITANGKKYPINIITDKGSGTYYYLVIKDSVAYTIIISTEEDLYSKIKDHMDREHPDDVKKKTPVEIISYEGGVELFSLPQIMGTIQKSEKVLEKDLLYSVRTDYRIGANFDHKTYGAGKIVATSTGNAGKADSRGMLAWVEVDFGKPYISGGKLQKTRKITNVYAKPYFDQTSNLDSLTEEEEETLDSQDPFLGAPEAPAPAPEEPSGVITIDDAKKLIFDTKGKFFTVVFIKKDGSPRTMNARLNVRKYLKGGELKYNPYEMGYIPVYDMAAQGYRMVNTKTIKTLQIGNKTYTLPGAIAESKEDHEMICEAY